MAIWQYSFELISKEGLKTRINDSSIHNYNFWNFKGCDEKYFFPITKLLPKNKSWSNDIILYGAEDSTCIKLVVENNNFAEINIRIDFRNDYYDFLGKVIEFCSQNSLLILDEEDNILPLNENSVIFHIENSEQYLRFKEIIKS